MLKHMRTHTKQTNLEQAKLKQKRLADALKKNILRRKAQMQQRELTNLQKQGADQE